MLLGRRICSSNILGIETYTPTGHCTQPHMQGDYKMPEATNVEDVCFLAGIAPPDIKRDVCARIERAKQVNNKAHCLFGHTPATNSLKSRCSFLSSVQPAFFISKVIRCNTWQKRLGNRHHTCTFKLFENLAN